MTDLAQERVAAAPGDPEGGWLPPPLVGASRGRRLLAALALLTLLVGVPAILALSIGWPLPDSLPVLPEVWAALSDPLEWSLIVDALALIAWAAWAHFALCVVAELSAAVRARRAGLDRRPLRVPLGGWSQELARRLVETALVTATIAVSIGASTGWGTILTPARPAVAAQDWAVAVPVTLAAHHDSPAPESLATGPATEGAQLPAQPPYPEYVVQPPQGGYYDSLWGIAETFLGDGQRWRDIYELNEGRDQPDGRALTRPELIRPGWRLSLPRDATGLAADPSPAEPSAQPVPSRGADLTGPGVTPDPSPPPAETPVPPDPVTPSPAVTSALPSSAASTEAEASAPAIVATSPEPVPDDDVSRPEPDDDPDDGVPLPAQAMGGLLAAAAVASLAAMRHRQRRRRPGGRSIALPGASVAKVEGRLRVLAEPEDLVFVDEALRALTLALRDDDICLPDVRSASLRHDRLELNLAEAEADAPSPFHDRASRTTSHARPPAVVRARVTDATVCRLPDLGSWGSDVGFSCVAVPSAARGLGSRGRRRRGRRVGAAI